MQMVSKLKGKVKWSSVTFPVFATLPDFFCCNLDDSLSRK